MRNLIAGVAFTLTVMLAATLAYMSVGWSFRDALYMVILTVYNEARAAVARGEVPSTESKLLQTGADKVVLPTHIGAERIAELLLYEESARFIESLERSHGFQRVLFEPKSRAGVRG